MKITKCDLPAHSLLNEKLARFDYIDCFKGAVIDENDQIQPVDFARAFFSTPPKWIEKLFLLRNAIVKHFGLKEDSGSSMNEKLVNFNCDLGE